MADDQIQVQITADTSAFEAAMQNAANAAQGSFDKIKQAAEGAGNTVDKTGKTGKIAGQTGAKGIDDWVKSFANLNSAFSSSVTGMILGTTTWQKAVQRLSQMALTDMVNLAQKELTTWITKDAAKTVVTKTGNATRDASDKASQSGFFTLLAQTLAQWLGFETSKTAANEAGNTTIQTADAAAAAASSALAVVRGMGRIQISAAEAAAAAYADSAELGLPGLAAAPGVAAMAYTTVLGYGTGLGAGLFSSAGGLWNVPSDTMAFIHKQETILPAHIAQPMRDFFTNGGATAGGGGGGGNFAITIQAIDTQTGAQFLMNNAGAIAQGLAREMRNGNSALRSALK
jgi:hypothetical protein